MEAALRKILKETLGEYVKGRALEKTDLSSFPLVLRDLPLNEKKVQEEFDEFHDSAVQLTSGKIGTVKVTPSWLGTIDVHATNIELTFSFSATQALKNQLKPEAKEEFEPYDPAPRAPPPNCPPRFCCAHDSSEKRVKCDPVSRECKICGITLTSSYKDFQLCPPCSQKESKCMICGCHAPDPNSAAEPPRTGAQAPPNCPQRVRDTSDSHAPRPCSHRQQGQMRDTDNAQQPKMQSFPAGNLAPPSHSPDRQSGPQGNLPPPPPPPQSGRQQNPRGDPPDEASMYLNARNANEASMYLSRPAVHMDHAYGNEQAFQTKLPPGASPQNRRASNGQTPFQQNRSAMLGRPQNQGPPARNNAEDTFAGFLRFVASDLWRTCHNDNQRVHSTPFASYDDNQGPFVRRGGA